MIKVARASNKTGDVVSCDSCGALPVVITDVRADQEEDLPDYYPPQGSLMLCKRCTRSLITKLQKAVSVR